MSNFFERHFNASFYKNGRKYRTLMWAVLRMNILLIVRYKLNFAIQIAGLLLFFIIIFFGGQAAVGGSSALGGTLDALIVGWFLLTMVQDAYGSLSGEITQESRWGTLEQLFMSPYGFGKILSAKVVANLLVTLIIGFLMLASMLLITDRTLVVDLITITPIVVLTLISVIGIGYMFAGLALIYKQVSSISQLMQFVVVGLVAAPAAKIPILKILPAVQGSSMLQSTMRNGVRLWEFPPGGLLVLVGVAAFYWLAGYTVFAFCSRIARKRGVMGHY
jgi:ABC-2 type transport system permease protein